MGNLSDKFSGGGSSSNIIEVIQGTCDGRTITVDSGSYTLANITAGQYLSTSYAVLNGSQIDYTPPENASHLLYKFDFQWATEGSSGISHFRLEVDGTEVQPAYKQFSCNYSGDHNHKHAHQPLSSVYYNFDLTVATDDVANGKFSSWTADKTIRVRGRNYSSTYKCSVHRNRYYETFGTSQVAQPVLTIIAFT